MNSKLVKITNTLIEPKLD